MCTCASGQDCVLKSVHKQVSEIVKEVARACESRL